MRLASKKAPTRAKATTSWLFDENHQPTGRFLCLPKVFSGRREYATCLSLEPNVIVSDLCYTSPDPDGLAFAVIESRMFIVWQAAVGGRLKSDYRFSNTVVWNNLPLPALDDDTRAALIEAGRTCWRRARTIPASPRQTCTTPTTCRPTYAPPTGNWTRLRTWRLARGNG